MPKCTICASTVSISVVNWAISWLSKKLSWILFFNPCTSFCKYTCSASNFFTSNVKANHVLISSWDNDCKIKYVIILILFSLTIISLFYSCLKNPHITSINSMNSIKRCWYILTLALDNIRFDIMHIFWPHALAIPISIFSLATVELLESFLISSFINLSKSCDNAWYKCVHNVCISILPREFDIFSQTY